MDFHEVLILCTQLLIVFAKNDCPKECTCTRASIGGNIAHCNELHINQVFSNNIHHLNVTNAVVPILESRFFQKVQLGDLQSIKIINSSLMIIDNLAFEGMPNLNFMDLSDNKLTHLYPDTFKNNNNLQMLSLSGNPLELTKSPDRPKYFLSSLSLTELDLSRCQLRQITNETFAELPNMISLNLDSNFIHYVSPQMFEKLKYLEEVNLSNNIITDIDPLLFADIEDMTTLKLSNNSLSKFDDVDIAVLKELDLSNNMFRTLESTTLEGTQDVAIVNFSYNTIERIDDDTFTDLNRLRYLDLSHNNLIGPLSLFVFETNEELETLSLSHNPQLSAFNGFSGEFNALYKLDISHCGLKNLTPEVFDNLQHISTLDLSGNELTELSSSTFKSLSRLNNLDLSNNMLYKLDDNLFSKNMDLRKLSISNNRIHNLPAKLFKPVVHLTSLDVSNCHLLYLWSVTDLDYLVEYNILSQLTHFNLENNKLTSLRRDDFESMDNLKSLEISKNTFQCNEDLILLFEWLVQQKISAAKHVGKSSGGLEHEKSGSNWPDMLSEICSTTLDVIPKHIAEKKNNVLKDFIGNSNKYDMITKNTKKEDLNDELYVGNIPEIDYSSKFGLLPEPVIKGTTPNDSEYTWMWPLFLVFICGASILLALFNLAALLLYRNGRDYKVAGYRSTFIAPLNSNLKFRRDAGTFYHKLYEECSVPNTVPIVKQTDNFPKSAKKNTIVLNGTSKGEDMV